MNILVKKAQLKDLEDIAKLNQKLFYSDSRFDKTLNTLWPKKNKSYYKKSITSNENLALVALSDNKIIGYLIASIQKVESYRLIGKIAELENMFILDKFRNKGVGSLLVKEFFKWAKSKKLKRIKVIASADNIQAISFYKRNGFTEYNIWLEANIK